MSKIKITNKKFAIGFFGAAFIALSLFVSGVYVEAQNRQGKATATGEQTIACINAALAARAGAIDDVDIDRKGGRIVCEVGIVADDGREYDVDVDLADNKIIRNVEDR